MSRRKVGDVVKVEGHGRQKFTLKERVKGKGWLMTDQDGVTRAIRDERIGK